MGDGFIAELSETRKELIKVQACDDLKDDWANIVRTQVSDPQAAFKLNTADATYHNDCRRTFIGQALLQLLKKKHWIQTYSNWCFYAVQG